jgi:hypothetical protein
MTMTISAPAPRRTTTAEHGYSIIAGVLYCEDARQCAVSDDCFADMIEDRTVTSIRVISLSEDSYFRSYITYDTSVIERLDCQMTLRKEIRNGNAFWYAYRRVAGKLHKRYVGRSSWLTEESIYSVAKGMPGSMKTIRTEGSSVVLEKEAKPFEWTGTIVLPPLKGVKRSGFVIEVDETRVRVQYVMSDGTSMRRWFKQSDLIKLQPGAARR